MEQIEVTLIARRGRERQHETLKAERTSHAFYTLFVYSFINNNMSRLI